MSRFSRGPKDHEPEDPDPWGFGGTEPPSSSLPPLPDSRRAKLPDDPLPWRQTPYGLPPDKPEDLDPPWLSSRRSLPEDPPTSLRSILGAPEDELDWPSSSERPAPSHSRFKMPHFSHIHFKLPRFHLKGRTHRGRSRNPEPTIYSSSILDDPETDIWGDSISEDRRIARLQEERRHAEERRRVKKRNRRVATVATSAAVGLSSLVAGKALNSNNDRPQRPPVATTEPSPDAKPSEAPPEEESRNKFEIQLDKIPSKEDLGETSETPIRTQEVLQREKDGESLSWDTKEGEIPEIIDEYNPNFVGAYKSTQGIAVNVYVAETESQEVTEEYEMHPETLQYILDNIEFFIPYAPEGSSKDLIIEHLEKLKSGEIDGVIELVLHTGSEATCLDATMQIINWIQSDCAASGVTTVASFESWERDRREIKGDPISANIPVIASSAARQQFKKKKAEDGTYDVNYDETELVAEPKLQSGHVVPHELIHGLENSTEGDGSHTEEYDPGHEITKWLIGADATDEENPNNYDFKGATTKSPKLANKIAELIEKGKLKPIITKKGH